MNNRTRWLVSTMVAVVAAVMPAMTHGQVTSEEELINQLLTMNRKGEFDQAEALLLQYLKEEPDAGVLLYYWALHAGQHCGEYERAIAVIDKTLPALKKNDPQWAARVSKERGIAVIFGRYKKTRNSEHLAQAKRDFLFAIKINPNISEAQFNLGVIYAMDSQVENSKSSFQAAIRSTDDPDVTTAMRQWILIAEQDPERYEAMMKTFY